MKKIRILALVLAVLMLPISLLVGCDNTETPEECSHKNWNKWETVQDRGCQRDSIRTRTCKSCGYRDIERVPGYEHKLTQYISDNNATCVADGTKSMRCEMCSYRETVADEGSVLGHDFVVYKPSEDGSLETAVCMRCEKAIDTRLLKFFVNFEGDKAHLSYSHLEIYTAGNADAAEEVKEDGNTYLSIKRTDDVFVGGSEFGVIITPRAEIFKAENIAIAPYYVVEFDIRITNDTKDLILLSGTKNGLTETFLKYNATANTIESNIGAVYALKDNEIGEWISVGVVLNDGKKVYEIYVNDYLIEKDIAYSISDGYYLGYDLECLKITMTSGNGVASEFDIDNIAVYLGRTPIASRGVADKEFGVYVMPTGEKVVYKLPAEECEHAYDEGVVKAQTCDKSGYTIKTCAVCGGQAISDIVAPSGHNLELKYSTDATCLTPETESYMCECGARDIKIISPALGHDIDRSEDATGNTVVEPTCLEAGYTAGPCVRCEEPLKVDYVDALGHGIDYEDVSSYTITAPTCTEGGSTTGTCLRCEVSFTTDEVAALGHKCDNPTVVLANCTEDGYTLNVCDRCELEYKTNEIGALTHDNEFNLEEIDGVWKMVVTCKRIDPRTNEKCTHRLEQDTMETPPTREELYEIVGASNFVGSATTLKYHFQDWPKGTLGDLTHNNVPSNSDLASIYNWFVPRYATLTVASDKYLFGNRFATLVWAPKNGHDKGHTGGNVQPYFDLTLGTTTSDRSIVFEASYRRTEGEQQFAALSTQVLDRAGVSVSAFMYAIDEKGQVVACGDRSTVYATLKEKEWTRISVVMHLKQGKISTWDMYVDGVLVEAGLDMFGGRPRNNVTANTWDNITAMRIMWYEYENYLDQGAADIDEVYFYYGELPVYIKGMSRMAEKGKMNFTDDSANSVFTPEGGEETKYMATTALGSREGLNAKGIYVQTAQNARFFVDKYDEKYGLHFVKNASEVVVPGAIAGYNSEISINYQHQHYNVVFETDIRFNDGTDLENINFQIFNGEKLNQAGGVQAFLAVENGYLVAGHNSLEMEAKDPEKLMEVEKNVWYTVAVSVDEYTRNYTVYINGIKIKTFAQTGMYFSGTSNYNKGLTYTCFEVMSDTDYDVSMKNTTYTTGTLTPPTYYGDLVEATYKYEIPSQKNTLLSFAEGESVKWLYAEDSVADSITLDKVDSTGKVGAAAGADAVYALKTGNWKTNGGFGPVISFKDTPYANGAYDFSEYETIKIKYFVETASDQNILLRLVSTSDTSYYYATLSCAEVGWKEVTLNIAEMIQVNSPDLSRITAIAFETKWAVADLKVGDAKGGALDGTTIYLAEIAADTKVKTGTIKLGVTYTTAVMCEGEHSIPTTGTVVEAGVHLPGYTYAKCENCNYIGVNPDTVVPAKGHLSLEKVLDTESSTGYFKIYIRSCVDCGTLGEDGETIIPGAVIYKEIDPELFENQE